MRFTMLLVLVGGAVTACGGDDGPKARTSCTDDGGCGGGVCFAQECYDACSALEPCATDEVCVRKDRAGTEVDVCLVAAEWDAEKPTCVNSQPDCDRLVAGMCQFVGCHGGTCVVEAMTDGITCERADGQMDVCTAGVCGTAVEPSACDDPTGTWVATIAHPENQIQAPCVVDGQVTQTVTMVVTKVDDAYAMAVETTNNVNAETGECFTYNEDWPGGVFERGVMTITKTADEQKDCNGVPTTVAVTYGFEGALNADCTKIAGTSWKEPADTCNPDSGRFEIPGVTFTKVTETAHAALR